MAGGNRNRPLGQRNDRPEVEVSIAPLGLPGTLVHPAAGQGVVLFAHGSGSSRLSPRNRLVAERLQRSGLGTLLFDLLHPEEADTARTCSTSPCSANGWHCPTGRLRVPGTAGLALGYFGASTGAAAALGGAVTRDRIAASCRAAAGPISRVSPTARQSAALLIVGGDDHGVMELNEEAQTQLRCESTWRLCPGRATCSRNRARSIRW